MLFFSKPSAFIALYLFICLLFQNTQKATMDGNFSFSSLLTVFWCVSLLLILSYLSNVPANVVYSHLGNFMDFYSLENPSIFGLHAKFHLVNNAQWDTYHWLEHFELKFVCVCVCVLLCVFEIMYLYWTTHRLTWWRVREKSTLNWIESRKGRFMCVCTVKVPAKSKCTANE